MLNIKELELLRRIVDNTNKSLYNTEDSELLQKTRGKINDNDMILVQKAWNTGQYIVMQSNKRMDLK